MKKLKLYLETSVWNFYFADDAPEKRDATHQFFDQVSQGIYEIFISDIVLAEIAKASETVQEQLISLIQTYHPTKLIVNDEIIALAHTYLNEGVLPPNSIEDATHAAMATYFSLDALISWNLKHLANFRRMKRINGVNLTQGYSTLDLITPMEVSNE